MTMTYRVEAYNLSHASENRIHDDATAQRFGFTGGLVQGWRFSPIAATRQ